MYRESLAIHEALGNKEGIANNYGNLGTVYWIRGDLEQAEAMYRKGLAIEEALGHKEGMANTYGNLGILYQTRGDPDKAEAMYHKALGLFHEIGATRQLELVQGWLEELRSLE